MAKRGNGEGSIRRRKDGRYEGRYTDGAGRQRSVYGKTRKETAKKLAPPSNVGRFIPTRIKSCGRTSARSR